MDVRNAGFTDLCWSISAVFLFNDETQLSTQDRMINADKQVVLLSSVVLLCVVALLFLCHSVLLCCCISLYFVVTCCVTVYRFVVVAVLLCCFNVYYVALLYDVFCAVCVSLSCRCHVFTWKTWLMAVRMTRKATLLPTNWRERELPVSRIYITCHHLKMVLHHVMNKAETFPFSVFFIVFFFQFYLKVKLLYLIFNQLNWSSATRKS